jgi:hypothetical protein
MALTTQHHTDNLDVIASGSHPDVALDVVAAHEVMTAIRAQEVRRGGRWLFSASVWQRFDRPWTGPDTPDGAQLIGSIYVTHGVPTAYDMTINRVTVTPYGVELCWTPDAVLNDALRLAGFSLADCGSVAPR